VRASAALIALSITLAACASPSDAVRVYVVQGGQQYFIRPTELAGDGPPAEIDFTVRRVDDRRSVTANFTIPVTDEAESAVLFVDSPAADRSTIQIQGVETIFVTADERRLTGTINYDAFQRLSERATAEDASLVFAVDLSSGRTLTFDGTRNLRHKFERLPPL
jgi:hypothetical protein